MMNIKGLRIGSKVHYQPSHYNPNEYENGIIKEIRDNITDAVWVVYNCAENWDKYQDYTSAKTNINDLRIGWRK